MIFIILCLGLTGPFVQQNLKIRLPWNFEVSFIAIVFYGLGYSISRSKAPRILNKFAVKLLSILVLGGALFLVVKVNGRVNMNRLIFGNIALFYLGSVCGISLCVLLSQIIPKNKFSGWLSRNTIIIFPLHLIIFHVFTGIGVIMFNLDRSFRDSMICNILFVLGGVVVCIPTAYIIRKFLPWMIGQRAG